MNSAAVSTNPSCARYCATNLWISSVSRWATYAGFLVVKLAVTSLATWPLLCWSTVGSEESAFHGTRTSIIVSMSNTNGDCPKFALTLSCFFFIPTVGYSLSLTVWMDGPESLCGKPASSQLVLIRRSLILPSQTPFFVKNIDRIRKSNPQPTTSPSVKDGP